MYKLNIRSLLYIAISETISLAAFCVPNHIAEIAIINNTALVICLKIKQIKIAIIGACNSISIEFTLSFILIEKYLLVSQ